jgi:diphthamide biosynthesis protein 3
MSIYEEVEIEDMDYDPVKRIYTYPCPCGDKFSISLEALWDGEDIATCPSCTLRIEVIYDEEDLPPLPKDDDDESVDEEAKKSEELEKDEAAEGEVDDGLAIVTKKSLSMK